MFPTSNIYLCNLKYKKKALNVVNMELQSTLALKAFLYERDAHKPYKYGTVAPPALQN